MRPMDNRFVYILEKIEEAEIYNEPFPYVEIRDFLSEEHLSTIIDDDQIHFDKCSSTEELIGVLQSKNYNVTAHAGCIVDIESYLNSLKNNSFPTDKELLEGYGLAFRLTKYNNPFLEDLINFMNSTDFKSVLMKKFNVVRDSVIMTAIQKYLTKYEVSPHPDVRQKSVTYLLNINRNDDIEEHDVHTYLLKFKDKYKYVEEFWTDNPNYDRCWVPWGWCDRVKTIKKNNTIIAFSPTDASMHGVKLDYDHTDFQRTQIYGNCFYKAGKSSSAGEVGNTWARSVSRLPQPKYHELKKLKDA